VLELREDLKRSFRDELEAYERENQMPYVTSIEQMGIEQGQDRERQRIALNLLRKNISLETISEVTGLSIDRLQKLEQGVEQGRDRERQTIALNLLRENIPLETIAEVTGLTIDRLQQLLTSREQDRAN
jgi:predicted HTH domain antitoxin